MLNNKQKKEINKQLNALIIKLTPFNIKAFFLSDVEVKLSSLKSEIYLNITNNSQSFSLQSKLCIHPNSLFYQTEKIFFLLCSKLKINTTVFARNCVVQVISKKETENFLNTFHLLENCSGAYSLGLLYKENLVALALFSKGRKMNRLPDDKRSFELLRFCCSSGITVTGGLSKLLKHFIGLKNAGDIMTYIDKQYGDGTSYLKLGFELHGETPQLEFFIHSKNKTRLSLSDYKNLNTVTKKDFYLHQTSGNYKLVLTVK